MLEAMMSSLQLLLDPERLLFLAFGCSLGLTMGLIPGLGGSTGLVLLLPLVFGMEQGRALALLIGMLAPICTADTFPAVLMGVPGTSGSQATVLDGFELAKKGQAARALSAAFLSSLLGGVISAFVLSASILIARPLILAFGFSEQLMLIVLALFMIGVLGGKSLIKGLAAAGFGLLLGSIGNAPNTGYPRLTFNTIYLQDGIPVILLSMGIFGIPSILELLTKGGSIAEDSAHYQIGYGWKQGLIDVVKNKFLVVKCAFIGTVVGFLPGLGGSVVDWIAYAFAKNTVKDNKNFGQGDIRGVIAPEAANNAKTGGALIPTLLFGIPGSGHMILLLAGFVIIGIEPGISMVRDNLHLSYLMIWTLAISNILGAAASFLLAKPISRLTKFNYVYIAPIIISLMFYASFQVTRGSEDFWMLIILVVLGIYIQRFGWSRSAIIIGFYLSRKLEPLTYQAMSFYGMRFLKKPLVLIIAALIVLLIISTYKSRKRSDSTIGKENESKGKTPQLLFVLFLLLFSLYYLFSLQNSETLSSLFPLIVGLPTIALLSFIAMKMLFLKKPHLFFADKYQHKKPATFRRTNEYYLLWMIAFVLLSYIVGFLLAVFLFITCFIYFNLEQQQKNRLKNRTETIILRGVLIAAVVIALIYVLSIAVNMKLPRGLFF